MRQWWREEERDGFREMLLQGNETLLRIAMSSSRMSQWMRQNQTDLLCCLVDKVCLLCFVTWQVAVRKAHSTWATIGPTKLLDIIFSVYTNFENNIIWKCYFRIRITYLESTRIARSRASHVVTVIQGKDSPTAQEPAQIHKNRGFESSTGPSGEGHKCNLAGIKWLVFGEKVGPIIFPLLFLFWGWHVYAPSRDFPRENLAVFNLLFYTPHVALTRPVCLLANFLWIFKLSAFSFFF